MRRPPSRSSNEHKRVAWNNRMVEERRRLGLDTVSLDWDTAIYLFHQGISPEEAARRVK